jgi:hypothetical protein
LATFFAAIDVIHFKLEALSGGNEIIKMGELQNARNDALLTYRKILMRLNMNEALHQQLENSLASLLIDQRASSDNLAATVKLARTILKKEWDVTKYGAFTVAIAHFKTLLKNRAG